MRLFSLILWLSILSYVSPTIAQNQTTMPAVCDESMKAYNERWIETGSQCIKTLLSKAKLQRNQIWNDRFPDLKTLCIEYERYWYFANRYADGIGIVRETQSNSWMKSILETCRPKGTYPHQELDLKVIQKFRQEIGEFAGNGSALLVDEAIPRFNPGSIYTLDGDKTTTPVADSPWHSRLNSLFIGDFYPYRERFWGDPMYLRR